MHSSVYKPLLSAVALLVAASGNLFAAQGGTSMHLHGALVDEPCYVQPGDESITLDFGTVIDKYLYLNSRTNSQPFTIHLVDCNIDSWPGGGTVTARFEGTESPELPGYLAVSNANSGVAIGLEESDGKLLPLGQNSAAITLANGSNALDFKAFVAGEPSALQNSALALGEFSAVTTFYLEYP
ncbi:type 1 fimbrial protein [Serratia proteamaculans]|uniref:fimbrial protein n=1 Tax=Serratia proteamaculans TaxID=28151 RepID=UPI001076B3F3|nr:fimbrial protein [Serratia proteamaculans]TFZ52682.1 type 1 fimbrial protein [Serratia proteamaculans]